MVEDKGTRTAAYITMRLMHLLGVTPGGLKKVAVRNIWNVQAILELHKLEAAGLSRDQAAGKTSSVTSQEAAIVQSGHRIMGVKVIPGTGKVASLEEVLKFWETDDSKLSEPDPAVVTSHNEILKRFGLTREDAVNGKFFWDYDIEISLAPLPKGVTPPTRTPILVPAPARRKEEEKNK